MVAAMWPSSDPASPQPSAGRAGPPLGPFAELLGQPYQRLKVAVLRQLAGLPEPSWSLAEAGQALTWLEPATANRLLSELRSVRPGAPPLARAAGVDERAAFAPFVAATAVLERDLAALHRLIDQGDDDA